MKISGIEPPAAQTLIGLAAGRADVLAFMYKLPFEDRSLQPDDDRYFVIPWGQPVPDAPRSEEDDPDSSDRRIAEALFYLAGGVMVNAETMAVAAPTAGDRPRRRPAGQHRPIPLGS